MKIADDYIKKGTKMNIGQKIKKVRRLRGLTQKELALKTGFITANADGRIAQYESGIRTPKKELRDTIAQTLNVNPRYLCDHSVSSVEDILYTLFDIEDTLGVSISLINGTPCLMFNTEISKHLLEWYSMKNKLAYKGITEEEYLNWKYKIRCK